MSASHPSGGGGDHPPPWEWLGRPDEETALLDGAGYSILSPSNDGGISLRSPYVRELVRAAPEMEALLRRWLANGQCETVPLEERWKRRQEIVVCGKCTTCEVLALTKRLDEARAKAGG